MEILKVLTLLSGVSNLYIVVRLLVAMYQTRFDEKSENIKKIELFALTVSLLIFLGRIGFVVYGADYTLSTIILIISDLTIVVFGEYFCRYLLKREQHISPNRGRLAAQQ